MLRSANNWVGYQMAASDGLLGSVEDLLFDDREWIFRFLVVDVGAWLPAHRVVISFDTIEQVTESAREVRVALTKRAIEHSPDVSMQNPVSMEAQLFLGKFFKWTPASVTRLPEDIALAISQESTRREKQQVERVVESRLRSVLEVAGYRIEAPDGDIGRLEDLVLDDRSWQIRYLIVNAGNWLSQRKVLLPRSAIEGIRWADRRVRVSLLRKEIKNSPAYDPAQPIARDYEQDLHTHYRRPPYWQEGGAEVPGNGSGGGAKGVLPIAGPSPTGVRNERQRPGARAVSGGAPVE